MGVSPILVSFHLGQCSTSTTMGDRVESTIIHPYNQATDLTSNHLNHVFPSCILARLFCCCCCVFLYSDNRNYTQQEPSLQPNFSKSPTIMCVCSSFKSKTNNSYTVIPKNIKKNTTYYRNYHQGKSYQTNLKTKSSQNPPTKIPPWTRSFQRLEERLWASPAWKKTRWTARLPWSCYIHEVVYCIPQYHP